MSTQGSERNLRSPNEKHKNKTGAIIADGTLYNPKKPNENFLNRHPKRVEFAYQTRS
jgi:hypothetical protein